MDPHFQVGKDNAVEESSSQRSIRQSRSCAKINFKDFFDTEDDKTDHPSPKKQAKMSNALPFPHTESCHQTTVDNTKYQTSNENLKLETINEKREHGITKEVQKQVTTNEKPKNETTDENQEQVLSGKDMVDEDKESENSDEEEVFKCDTCEATFSQWRGLRVHQTHHKMRAQTIKCSLCPAVFNKTSSLKAHFKMHRRVIAPYRCDLCPVTFTSNEIFKKHMETHVDERFCCEYCPEKFLHFSKLAKHLDTHDINKPHQCPHCDCCFVEQVHLRKHVLLHNKTKEYKCTECPASFNSNKGLKTHLDWHKSGFEFYKCPMNCPDIKCFVKQTFFDHMVNSHSVPLPNAREMLDSCRVMMDAKLSASTSSTTDD